MTFGPGGLDFWTYRKRRGHVREVSQIVSRRDRVSERHDATWGSSRRGRKAAQANKQTTLVARSAICLAGAGTSAPSMSTERFSSSGDGDSSATSPYIFAGEWQGSVCVTCALRAIFGLWPSPVHISIYLPNIDSSVPASVRGGLTFGPGGLDFCQHFDRSKSLARGG